MLTFDQLFRKSDPGRVKRSATVRGPPLEIDAHSDHVYHVFNFKSFPSTTGLRHHGYIKFVRPKTAGKKALPLQHVPCVVDCTCPDFRYRFAWLIKQKGSSQVGPRSMNQAWNQPPIHTNPHSRISLCKHILAARDYIYGMLSHFSGEPDTEEKLTQLVGYANRRWNDWQGQSDNAKERERWFKAAKAARAQGLPPPPGPVPMYRPGAPKLGQMAASPSPELPPPETEPPKPRGPVLPKAGRPTTGPFPPLPKLPPEPPPLAVPPAERGRALPSYSPPELPRAGMAGIVPPGKRGRGLPPIGRGYRESLVSSVDKLNGSRYGVDQQQIESMRNLQEAIKVVEEIEQDELAAASNADNLGGADEGSAIDVPPPSEPPVSDDAVGADTQGNVVLQLLTSINDLLVQLVGAEEAEIEGEPPLPPEGEEDEEGEEPVDALPMPPDEEEEEEDDEFKPGHAPVAQD